MLPTDPPILNLLAWGTTNLPSEFQKVLVAMDSTAGDLAHAAKEFESNIEKKISHDSNDEVRSRSNARVEKQEQDISSSGSSTEDFKSVEKLGSHIVKVNEVKEGDEDYAHLPAHEREIIKRQLDVPNVKVTFLTLFRYATRNDIIIIVVSCICAIAGGAVMPLMTVSKMLHMDKQFTNLS